MAKGQLIVISGPSGVGKSTLIRSLTAKLQRQPFFSVSATTRKMRPGEIDHVNYHFITQAEFDRMVAQNEFLEHATYAAHSYGTPAAPILAQLEAMRRGEITPDELESARLSCASALRSVEDDPFALEGYWLSMNVSGAEVSPGELAAACELVTAEDAAGIARSCECDAEYYLCGKEDAADEPEED